MTPAERDELYRWRDWSYKPLWNYFVAVRDPTGSVINLCGPLPALPDALDSQLSYKVDLGEYWLSQGFCVTEVFQADSREEAEVAAAKCKAAASRAYDVGQFRASRRAARRAPEWYRTRVAAAIIVASVALLHIITAVVYGSWAPVAHDRGPIQLSGARPPLADCSGTLKIDTKSCAESCKVTFGETPD